MAERVKEDGFLGRWSRLKRETRAEEPTEDRAVSPVPEPLEEPLDALPPEALPPEALPAERVGEAPELPSLDSLGSDSDYTGFLRREVPAQLRREALRKAWVSDPVIAGFRGFADYDWDYNAPGYGALRPTDDIARLLDAILPDEKREEVVVVEEEIVVAAEQSVEAEGLPTLPPPPLPPPQPSPALGGRGSQVQGSGSPLPRPAGEG